jgi:hypothetical protein
LQLNYQTAGKSEHGSAQWIGAIGGKIRKIQKSERDRDSAGNNRQDKPLLQAVVE